MGFYLLSFGSRLGSFLSSAKRRSCEKKEKRSWLGSHSFISDCVLDIFMQEYH